MIESMVQSIFAPILGTILLFVQTIYSFIYDQIPKSRTRMSQEAYYEVMIAKTDK